MCVRERERFLIDDVSIQVKLFFLNLIAVTQIMLWFSVTCLCSSTSYLTSSISRFPGGSLVCDKQGACSDRYAYVVFIVLAVKPAELCGVGVLCCISRQPWCSGFIWVNAECFQI
uniref:Uncharacterized protein n=1 Tax=Anguilla anguilla TaxID=7936 RepID=A0A0E9WZF5_ANGAN